MTTSQEKRRIHHQLAITLNNVAVLLHRMGRSKEAMQHCHEALYVRTEDYLGDDVSGKSQKCEEKVDLMARYRTLSNLEDNLRLKEAKCRKRNFAQRPLDLYQTKRDCVINSDVCEEAFSMSLPDPMEICIDDNNARDYDQVSALIICNMGILHHRSGALDAALQHYNMAKNIIQKTSDEDISTIVIRNIAWAQYAEGRPDEALQTLTDCLCGSQGELSSDKLSSSAASNTIISIEHMRCAIIESVSLMGRIFCEKGDTNVALELCRETLRLRCLYQEADHMDITVALYNMGVIMHECGETDDAIEYCKVFLDRIKSEGYHFRHSLQIAGAYQTVGAMSVETNSISFAVTALVEALNLQRSVLSEDNADTAKSLSLLGKIFHGAGCNDKAMRYYGDALKVLRSCSEDESDEVATLLCDIGQLHHDLGNLGAAMDHFEEALQVSRCVFGDRNSFVVKVLNLIGMIHNERGETEDAAANFADASRILEQLDRETKQQPCDYDTMQVCSSAGLQDQVDMLHCAAAA